MSSRSMIYPSRRLSVAQNLPFDVLSEIYQYLPDLDLPNNLEAEVISPKTGPYILRPNQYPWSLTRICSSWRYAAMYEPCLWTRVHLEVNSRPVPPGKVKLLQTYLSRSNARNLAVSIHCTFSGQVEHNPLLSAILPTCPRWKFFSLHVLDTSVLLFKPLRGNLPTLQVLHLYVAHQAQTPSLTATHNMFEHAPRLHTIRFRNSEDRSTFIMPYHNDRLRLYQGPTSSIPRDRSLEWMGNLRWCAIAANLTIRFDSGTSVTAPLLKELSIHERLQPFRTRALMDILTVPNLEILRVRAAGHIQLSLGILGLLQRSMCATTLTQVCLDIPDLAGSYMLDVLSNIPYVVTLRLTAKRMLPGFCNRWIYDPETHRDNPCILRYLENLDLGRCTFTPNAELALLDFVQSRWVVGDAEEGGMTPEKYFAGPMNHSVQRLKMFGVPYKYQRTKRSRKKVLKIWKKQGLEIVFGSGNQNRL
ncbi:hypothetical protein D9757_000976 [Collybiopsis confluens]|uniref:F-box domain-containing protein n=1 Tax=Collybiopsis confluens TaxID=2823264 RepID=A0A8H5MFM1_9AGAR|nr:hypothetical protein D9757_000976 [Collybiopsis confluens]